MSLLLDALRQAELNKVTKTEPPAETVSSDPLIGAVDIDEDEDQSNTRLIELDFLSETEPATESQSIDENTQTIESENTEKTPLSEHKAPDLDSHNKTIDGLQLLEIAPLESLAVEQQSTTSSISHTIENTKASSFAPQKTVLALEDDLTSEPTIINQSETEQLDDDFNPSLANESPKIDQIIKPVEQLAPKIQTSNSSSQESLQTTKVETAKNILNSKKNHVIKPVHWLILLFIISIFAVYYLYLLSSAPNEDTYASSIESELTPGLMQIANSSSPSPAKITINKTQRNHLKPAKSSLPQIFKPLKTKPIQTTTKPSSPTPESLQFTIEPEYHPVNYPDKTVKIKIKRQNNAEMIALNTAYKAYQQADYDKAKHYYIQVLKNNHRNIDALNAMGSIAEIKGNLPIAKVYFEKVLQLGGNQIYAQQALVRLQTSPTVSDQESHYKSLISQNPDNATLYASLAKVYSSKQQWLKAQKAYFRTIEIAPKNPDYHFNLAITLDHLSKSAVALRYYQKALLLSQTNKSMFENSALKLRIQQLKDQ